MKSLVVYGSRHGNTGKIASAIAEGLRSVGTVDLLTADKARGVLPQGYDLVLVGGPTEGHNATVPVVEYVDHIEQAFSAVLVATFDTRLRWPRWLSGSAADALARRLQGFGANLALAPTSFFVSGNPPVLEPGELERAEAWGRALAIRVAPHPVARS